METKSIEVGLEEAAILFRALVGVELEDEESGKAWQTAFTKVLKTIRELADAKE